MATPTDEFDKKRLLEITEETSNSRPPKKRLLPSRSTSPSHNTDDQSEDQEALDVFKEPLDIYRRDAISRQWKEYMRHSRRLIKRVESLEEKKSKGNHQLHIWQTQFDQLQKDLQRLLTDYALEHSRHQIFDYDIESILTEEWMNDHTVNIKGSIKQGKDITQNNTSELADTVKTWSLERKQFIEKFSINSGINEDLVQDYKSALYSWIEVQKSLNEASNQYYTSKFKFLLLSEELRLVNLKLEKSERILQETRIGLLNAEKQLVSTEPGKQSMNEATEMNIYESQIVPSDETGKMHTNIDNQQDPLIRAQRTLDHQLREINIIKEQRIDLKQQIVQLELDLIQIPESRVHKLPTCRQLYQSREYQRDKSQHLSGHVEKLEHDLEDMQRHRRQLMDEMDTEQMAHIHLLEDQMGKLEYELTRIRGQRDGLQCKIEIGKAKSETARSASVKEWETIAETRKQRAHSLEKEVTRWLQKYASRTGSKQFYQYVNSLCFHVLSFDTLLSEKNNLEEQLDNMKQQLVSRTELTDQDKNMLNEELSHYNTVKNLEKELEEFKSVYGFDPLTVEHDQVINILQDRVQSEQSSITQARQRLESLQNTENQLLNEIRSVAKAYNEYDEQNLSKIKNLETMEDEIIQLQCDRVYYSQTFTALNKSKDAHAMVANALTKQIEKQMNYIKQLNEREKNLNSQISNLDREITAGKSASDIYHQKITELRTSVNETKERLISAKDKVIEAEKSLMEKIRSIEEGAHNRLRMEENSEVLRRRIEANAKIEKPSELRLKKEKEEYRSLLNCSSCGTRLKSHVLMRCMHTFCKNCLDIRVETRQRRCPTCSETFGVNDIRQFYL
ncbi:unnamed protein product [Cunninghamella echinulata]